MKLEEKIRNRKLVYLLRKAPRDAFRLALLYFILAKRKNSAKKIIDACMRSKYWIKITGLRIPESLNGVINPYILINELERVLVTAKVDTRLDLA